MKRFLTITLALATLAPVAPGCSKKVPEDPFKVEQQRVLNNRGRLVQDLARPENLHAAKIEGATLVRGLNGTGADEPPSTYQQLVLQDLQRDVDQKRTAKSQIASLDTAIVLLETIVPPGARVGDRLDVTLTLQPGSEATSVQGGFVRDAELYQYMAADVIRRGYKLGVVDGFVTLDPDLVAKKSPVAYKQGKIVGGARVARSRPIWLELKENERSPGIAKQVEDVINKRFSYTKSGYAGKKKVAEAKAGATRINLEVPEEYRDNIVRYVNVVCAISFFETADELNERVDRLAVQLLNPEESEFASIQLEAIGPRNEKVLDAIRKGMDSSDPTVRFNSAIASAYFNERPDRQRTARILADFAANDAERRPAALATLGVCMKTSFDVDAELRKLLAAPENETRYGAFRALWTRNPSDYMIQGENLGDRFGYHCLNCGGAPFAHVSMSDRPEIVLFNAEQIFLQGEFYIEANPRLTIRTDGDEIVVKKYETSDGINEQRRVGFKVDEIIRAIVEIGGSYSDVVSFLTQAKSGDYLKSIGADGTATACAFGIDALPGAKNARFKRIRDVAEIERREEARTAAELASKKEKKSFWSRMNPTSWFGSDAQEPKPSDEFSLDEFDAANGEAPETDASQEFDAETESADAALKNDEFAVDEESEKTE
ncbi:MAG: flagellar basal body P-ring protein FlgI [Thermoguttaceae bacterium]|nr:flagellar basal body P-ring protein FlgI [Thermoguttaceae bacterium]